MVDFASWLLFALTGRIIIQTWFLFPFPPFVKMPYWLEKLHRCDLCAGVWVYAILAAFLQLDLFGLQNIATYFTTGVVTSYLIHIFVIGVKEKYAQPIVINA